MLLVLSGISVSFSSCTYLSDDTLFERIPVSQSNIDFSNNLSFSDSFNIFTANNFYSGGGVGLGDINNDGLLDVYLVANQKSNKLYLNEGNFQFRDITEESGTGGNRPWSTGVSMVDINGDGWLDIYVCNSGTITNKDRRNELFINNGDLTFTERAEEFGLAGNSYSIHASFFDYDKDGDLDMYLLNYTFRSVGSFDLENNQREERHLQGGDRLYRNELISNSSDTSAREQSDKSKKLYGTPKFTNVTKEAGIYSSEIGMGLGVSVGDLNRDGWEDIFISNDFFERDYLYINNQDGTFREVLEQQMNSISTTSMGGDIADLDNDGFPEIFVTDMLPEQEERLKTITTFADWEQYQFELEHSYYHQFTRNVLQYNNGNDTFSEIGRYAGVEATGWSWGALIADFNLDGRRDIFIPNGVYKDMTDQDHMLYVSRPDVKRTLIKNNRLDFDKLIGMMPSNPISNYIYENRGALRFINRAKDWGLDDPSFSNGSAYGDLDGDGDLDLIVNNVNMKAFVYRNQTTDQHPERGWLQVKLEGESPNSLGVGAQLVLIADGQRLYAEQMPVRGFQSSIDTRLHIGLGEIQQIDTLWVRWPDGRLSRKIGLKSNELITVSQDKARSNSGWNKLWLRQSLPSHENPPLLEEVTTKFAPDWRHAENTSVDFKSQPLLFHSRSTEGPPLCIGDVNKDERQDFYIGGAKGQSGALFVQTSSGGFNLSRQNVFETDSGSEDTDCAFFDANEDGAADLYVASGGSEFPSGASALADRLYINNGRGDYESSPESLPTAKRKYNRSTGVVAPADFDSDGDTDLFVGIRMQSETYGIPVGGYLLENDGNAQFDDVTKQKASSLSEIGFLTGAKWGDIDGDGDTDLLIAGEWMPVELFLNEEGEFSKATTRAGLDSTRGWWNTLELADLDGDGDLDWVGGNHGLNSRFRATAEKPVEMWVNDFDHNGSIEHILTTYNDGQSYPKVLRHDLVQQVPMLSSRVPNYHSYAGKTVQELFSEQELQEAIHLQANLLASSVGWNDGKGHFKVEALPMKAQWFPVYSVLASDLNEDGRSELLIGGNLHRVKPQAGRYDASYGLLLRQDSAGSYQALSPQASGYFSEGETRAIRSLQYNGQTLILVARNNKPLQVFKVRKSNLATEPLKSSGE